MQTIFLTNDDGYISKGLLELRIALSKIARVVVVAPAHEKSACGHGLCATKPLQLIEIEKDFYKLDDGTPTDCVYIGLHELFTKKKPDLLISGINIGANMGEDTTYSGTVAGAIEGTLNNISSIAISQAIEDKYSEDDKTLKRDFSLSLDFIVHLAKDILNGTYKIGHRKFLNVNVPAITKRQCKGVKTTQLGYRIFNPIATTFISPRKQRFHWIGLNPLQWQERNNKENIYIDESNCYVTQQNESISIISDFEALKQGYISVTPMQLDLTSYADIENLYTYIQKSY